MKSFKQGLNNLIFSPEHILLYNNALKQQAADLQSSLLKPVKEVSLLSPGTGNIQEVHQGQVVFGSHSCRLLLGRGPPAHLLSDRQIHPHCLKTNEPIHLEVPIDKHGGEVQH